MTRRCLASGILYRLRAEIVAWPSVIDQLLLGELP